MRRRARRSALVAAVLGLGVTWACRAESGRLSRADSLEAGRRASRLAARLATDSGGGERPLARWILPRDLAEVSGLAIDGDGHLVAHGDEVGVVTVLDARRGLVLRRFPVGERTLRVDFEGITAVGDTLYLVTSDGVLYRARDGRGRHPAARIDTRLGRECEFEGVAYDARLRSLLLACKTVSARERRGHLIIYRWPLGPAATDSLRVSVLSIPLRLIGPTGLEELHPSDITIDPRSGDYVVLAAQEKLVVRLTPAGQVVSVRPLPGDHPQPEGIAITPDGLLIISDEAATAGAATLTLYRWPLASSQLTSPS